MSKGEGMNPSIGCAFSKQHEDEEEHEKHAPVGFGSPHGLASFRENKLDTANSGLLES